MKNTPNYKKIYTDLINKKFPEKKQLLSSILDKKKLSVLDVINIDSKLPSLKEGEFKDGRFRSYDKATILQILDYQKENNCSNVQVAKEFGLSKNTITKWKKIFIVTKKR